MEMTIVRFNRPMNDFVSLREAMDRLFEDSFIRPQGWNGFPAGQIGVPVDLWEPPLHRPADQGVELVFPRLVEGHGLSGARASRAS
jgi:hypothetical protein